MRTDFSF